VIIFDSWGAIVSTIVVLRTALSLCSMASVRIRVFLYYCTLFSFFDCSLLLVNHTGAPSDRDNHHDLFFAFFFLCGTITHRDHIEHIFFLTLVCFSLTPTAFFLSLNNNSPLSRNPAETDESVNPGNNLFVNGLSNKTEQADLEDLFGKYGKVRNHPHSTSTRLRLQ
jgi:hypothetical protein